LSDGKIIYLGPGELAFWGIRNGNTELSAFYNNDTAIKRFLHSSAVGHHAWHFISKDRDALYNYTGNADSYRENFAIKDSDELTGDYIALPSLFLDSNNKLITLDFLGYVAYLRSVISSNTKLIISTDSENNHREILEDLDPNFSENFIQWIDCGSDTRHCNQLIKVRDGGTLKVFIPTELVDPMHLLNYSKLWTRLDLHTETEVDMNEVVYIESKSIGLDKMLLSTLEESNRSGAIGQVQVLRPDKTFSEQSELLRAASLIIGTTAALTDKLWLFPENCGLNLLELVEAPNHSSTSSWSSIRHDIVLRWQYKMVHHNVIVSEDLNLPELTYNHQTDRASFKIALDAYLAEL